MTEAVRPDDIPWGEHEIAARLLDAVGVLACVVDESGRLVWWNEQVPETTGYAAADLAATNALEFVASADRDRAAEALASVLAGDARTVQLEVVAADGERLPYEFTVGPLPGGGGERRAVAAVGREVDRPTAREQERERYRRVVETVADGVYALDADNRFVMVNDAFAEMLGYDREELLGAHASLVVEGNDVEAGDRAHRELRESDRDVISIETELVAADGERIPVANRIAHFPLADGTAGRVGTIRDITDRKRRERRLADLHGATRELMGGETTVAVCEIAVRTARTVLNLPHTGIWLYDDDADELRPMITTDGARDLFEERPTFPPGESLAWDAFDAGETRVYDDVRTEPNAYDPETRVRSQLLVPIGGHGVLASASTEVGALDESDVYAARILAANTEAALERAEREQVLERQRDALAALNRVNELVGEIIRALTEATTREETEQVVCERLAESEFYRNAWVGERTADGGIRPRARAGCDDGYLETVTALSPDAVDAGGLVRALREGDLRVVQFAEDPSVPESIRKEVLARGYRSGIVVPLAHGETVYGALVVNATREDAFGERERAAFAVLGETVGFAIEAVQNRKLLFADTVTELEFRMTHRNSFFVNASGRLSCRCRLLWGVPVEDGLLQYVAVEGLDTPEALLDRARAEPAVESVRLVSEADGECLFEAVLSSRSIFKRLVDAGAQPVEAVAEDGTARVTAETPHDADVREIVDAARRVAPDVELVAKRDAERPVRTARELHRDIQQRLTGKQRTALHAAYFGGYYDWPRDSTAEELADSMGISSATLHYHLRAAERELVAAFVDDSAPHR